MCQQTCLSPFLVFVSGGRGGSSIYYVLGTGLEALGTICRLACSYWPFQSLLIPQEADFYGPIKRFRYSVASVWSPAQAPSLASTWSPAGNGTGKQRSGASGEGGCSRTSAMGFPLVAVTGLFRRSFQHGCLSQEEAPVPSCHQQAEEVTVPHCHWQLSIQPVVSPVLCHTATNSHFTKL